MLIAEIIFLLGIEYQEGESAAVCGVIAGFIHYSFLAAFSWMALEGTRVSETIFHSHYFLQMGLLNQNHVILFYSTCFESEPPTVTPQASDLDDDALMGTDYIFSHFIISRFLTLAGNLTN